MSAKLRQRYEKIYEQYRSRKNHFATVIARWEDRGYRRLSKQGAKLLQEAESLIGSIHNLEHSGGQEVQIAGAINRFKKVYKELHEITKPTIRQWIEAIIIAGSAALIIRNFVGGLYHVPTGSAEPTIFVGDRIVGSRFAYFFSPVKHGDYIILDNPLFVYDQNPLKRLWQKYIGLGIPLLGIPEGPDYWTKRVIACPGDTIEGRIENGKTAIYLNGKRLNEPYINPYPLIALRKKVGLIPQSFFDYFGLPPILNQHEKLVFYTYNPAKSFEHQPFYTMQPNEVVYDPRTGEPMLKKPYEPDDFDVFGPMTLPEGKYWVMGDNRQHSKDSRFWLFLDGKSIIGRASFIGYSVDSEEPWWGLEFLKNPINFWFSKVRWNRIGKSLRNIPSH